MAPEPLLGAPLGSAGLGDPAAWKGIAKAAVSGELHRADNHDHFCGNDGQPSMRCAGLVTMVWCHAAKSLRMLTFPQLGLGNRGCQVEVQIL